MNNLAKSSNLEKARLKYKDILIGNITLTDGGYCDISEYKPTDINVVFVCVGNWSTSKSKTAFGVTASGKYVIGTANDVINGLRIYYYYYE